jgi:hypothetical protein
MGYGNWRFKKETGTRRSTLPNRTSERDFASACAFLCLLALVRVGVERP